MVSYDQKILASIHSKGYTLRTSDMCGTSIVLLTLVRQQTNAICMHMIISDTTKNILGGRERERKKKSQSCAMQVIWHRHLIYLLDSCLVWWRVLIQRIIRLLAFLERVKYGGEKGNYWKSDILIWALLCQAKRNPWKETLLHYRSESLTRKWLQISIWGKSSGR